MSGSSARPLLIDCARQQLRVIGALVIREMHTRFGHHRLGYIWLFFEPLLLGSAIALLHYLQGSNGTRSSFEFFSIGYVLFFLCRGVIARAPGTIRANRGLLYHRQVTLPDLFFARNVIEGVAATGVMAIFVFSAVVVGSEAPDSPMKMLFAMGLMLLLCQGIGLLAGAGSTEWEGLERFVQMTTFLMMPISGLFFMVDWLPEWAQEIVLWIPFVHLFELLRDGQFGDRFRPIYDLTYVGAWILGTHLLGLAALRVMRTRIGLG